MKTNKKVTHFDNEIDGSTHYDKEPFWDFSWEHDKWSVIASVVMIVSGVIIFLSVF